jgi:hypothetical protein
LAIAFNILRVSRIILSQTPPRWLVYGGLQVHFGNQWSNGIKQIYQDICHTEILHGLVIRHTQVIVVEFGKE